VGAETTVSGQVGGVVWTAADSPFRVAGPCTVEVGRTLRVESGVEVLFDVDAALLVLGSLNVLGSRRQPVKFRKGLAEEWGGITLMSKDTSRISNAEIRDGHSHPLRPDRVVYGVVPTAGRGGAIYVRAGHLDLGGTRITNNRAVIGGGICIGPGATANLSRCTIDGNRAVEDGGGLHGTHSAVSVKHCKLSRNSASDDGGGVWFRGGRLEMTSTYVTGNAATGGPACQLSNVDAQLAHCTFSNNTSIDIGPRTAAMEIAGEDSSVRASLLECIVWGNSPADIVWESIAGTDHIPVSIDYCDIGLVAIGALEQATMATDLMLGLLRSYVSGARVDWSAEEIKQRLTNASEVTKDVLDLLQAAATANLGERLTDARAVAEGVIAMLQAAVLADLGAGNISEDPSFVDAAESDFTLRPTSPCIDAGDIASQPDIALSRPDIGAYCYVPERIAPPFPVLILRDRPGSNESGLLVLRYATPSSATAILSVYSAAGELTRLVRHTAPSRGVYEIVWDGFDESGHFAGPGSYLYSVVRELDSEHEVQSSGVVLVAR